MLSKRAIENPELPNKRPRTAVPWLLLHRYNYKSTSLSINKYKDQNSGDTMVQYHNSMGNPYKIIAPPGICKFVRLGEGGNIGQHEWCKDEKSASLGFVYTNEKFPPLEDESPEAHLKRTSRFQDDQNEFLEFLKDSQTKAITMLFENCEQIKTAYMRKAKAISPPKTSAKKIQENALKLVLKAAKSPIKETGGGNFEFSVKCGAYQNSNNEMIPRKVVIYDGNNRCKEGEQVYYKQHESVKAEDIKHGAILRPIITMRLYTTPGYKTFGTTFQLDNSRVVFHKNGSNKPSNGALSESQLKVRGFEMRGLTNSKGKYNVYINDINGRKYLHRPPIMKTKYCDLENGNLGKFANVTPETAKFTATFVEDKNSKAYFDHIEQMVSEVATYLFNDPKILKSEKKEFREAAEAVATDTGGNVDDTMKNLFMDTIQSPIAKKGDLRELKVSQRLFNTVGNELVRNELKYCDKEMKKVECPILERGCSLAPVLEPQIYVLANGTAGVKLSINLATPIVVEDQQPIGNAAEETDYTADMF